jgi:hypothetical protein
LPGFTLFNSDVRPLFFVINYEYTIFKIIVTVNLIEVQTIYC